MVNTVWLLYYDDRDYDSGGSEILAAFADEGTPMNLCVLMNTIVEQHQARVQEHVLNTRTLPPNEWDGEVRMKLDNIFPNAGQVDINRVCYGYYEIPVRTGLTQ